MSCILWNIFSRHPQTILKLNSPCNKKLWLGISWCIIAVTQKKQPVHNCCKSTLLKIHFYARQHLIPCSQLLHYYYCFSIAIHTGRWWTAKQLQAIIKPSSSSLLINTDCYRPIITVQRLWTSTKRAHKLFKIRSKQIPTEVVS